MTVPRKRPPDCPIERFISVVSGRWKAMILWQLFVEPQRYSALEQLIPGVAQRPLSQALAELSADGVIARVGHSWMLTPLGEAMRPALSSMFAWGSLHQRGYDLEAPWPDEVHLHSPPHPDWSARGEKSP